jgi:mono/diheme cytochrome c family protein
MVPLRKWFLVCLGWLLLAGISLVTKGWGASGFEGEGYRFLTTKAYLPPDFSQQVFDEVWQTWEEPLRSQAAAATPERRRQMAFDRYGLTSAPGDTSGKPQQYVVDKDGGWTMNCLACHQGQVAGRVIPGLNNSLFDLESLTEETRATKQRLGQPLTRMDLGLLVMPLGTTRGTSNAVMFGVALMARRDADLNVLPARFPPRMVHHDHDAPAWWHFRKKKHLYIDAFAAKGHRALMQFMLIKENGPTKFRQWEPDFQAVYDWLEGLEPPKYPFAIDAPLAERGRQVFADNCARCHGTYGKSWTYPEKVVPIDELGTDRVRFDALSSSHRASYEASWFAHYGQEKAVIEPVGYAAPPLDGIWATAPYFHNGSVPTLWHVLHPSERPSVWRRSEQGYDQQHVGLEVRTFDTLPAEVKTNHERRQYFDTSQFGKSAAGHLFVDDLDEPEKQAVLEYLKTL